MTRTIESHETDHPIHVVNRKRVGHYEEWVCECIIAGYENAANRMDNRVPRTGTGPADDLSNIGVSIRYIHTCAL